MRVASTITLTDQERSELQKLSRGGQSAVRARERSLIVLMAADGFQNKEISQRTGMDPGKVARWRQRYASQRLPGILKDKYRPGGIPAVSKTLRTRIIKLTLQSKPLGATHWSRETMAREAGVSPSSVGRIWAAHGLKPHRVKTFKLSNDKRFEEKLEDIVGLYLSPPEHAIVLSCDEKSQIQALDRTRAWPADEKGPVPNHDP